MEYTKQAQPFPVEDFAAGTTILQQGDAADTMYVLVEGRLRVETDGVVLAEIFETGSLVGEISLLLGSKRGATVIAETDSRLEVIEDVDRFFRDPKRAFGVARQLAERLVEMDAKFLEVRALVEADKPKTAAPSEESSPELEKVRRYLKAWRISI